MNDHLKIESIYTKLRIFAFSRFFSIVMWTWCKPCTFTNLLNYLHTIFRLILLFFVFFYDKMLLKHLIGYTNNKRSWNIIIILRNKVLKTLQLEFNCSPQIHMTIQAKSQPTKFNYKLQGFEMEMNLIALRI